MELKQVFMAEDGTTFNSKAEAVEYMRRPQIKAALMTFTEGNEELSDWLAANHEDIEGCFSVGTVKRVTKAERNKLRKGFEKLAELHEGEPVFAFMLEHAEAIVEGFKWPNQRRLQGEDKAAAIAEALSQLTDGNDELVAWIAANEEQLKEAFAAGKPKREVPEKARKALEEYRAKKAAEKAAAEAAAEAAE
jgi:dsDNA-binding SOS-regulon protein